MLHCQMVSPLTTFLHLIKSWANSVVHEFAQALKKSIKLIGRKISQNGYKYLIGMNEKRKQTSHELRNMIEEQQEDDTEAQ